MTEEPVDRSDDRSRKAGRLRHATSLVIVAGAAILTILVLRYVVVRASRGVPPLGILENLTEALIALGGALTASLRFQLWPIQLSVAAVLALAARIRYGRLKTISLAEVRTLAAPAVLFMSAVFFLAQKRSLGILASAVLATLVRHGPARTGQPATGRSRYLILVPLAISVLLRFSALATYPPGYAEHAVVHHVVLTIPFYERLLAVSPATGWDTSTALARAMVTEQHAPTCFVTTLGFLILGVSPTVTVLVSAVLGCLTVWVAYLTGTRLAGFRAGLVFALLLAAAPWHASASRYGDAEHVLSPLHALLSLYLVFGAPHTGRWRDYLLAGLALGAAFYIYAPSQALVGALLAFGLYVFATHRHELRRDVLKLAAGLAVFAATSGPAVKHFVDRGRTLPVRTTYLENHDVAWFDANRFSDMAKREWRELFVAATDPWFTKPGGGLGATEAAASLGGIVLLVWGLRRRESRDLGVLLLVALPVTMLPGVLAHDESFRRLILAATLLLLVASLVVDRVLEALHGIGLSRRLLAAGVAVAGLLYASVNAYAYFELSHLPESESHRYHQAMGRYVAGALEKEYVVIAIGSEDCLPDHYSYLKLFAYSQLREARAHGHAPEALFQVVAPGRLAAAIDIAKARGTPATVLADPVLVMRPTASIEVKETIKSRLPGAFVELRHESSGPPFLAVWKIAPPGHRP